MVFGRVGAIYYSCKASTPVLGSQLMDLDVTHIDEM
jgi:hypothetical protein